MKTSDYYVTPRNDWRASIDPEKKATLLAKNREYRRRRLQSGDPRSGMLCVTPPC